MIDKFTAVHTGLIAHAVKRLLNAGGLPVDQGQHNGLYGVCQLRARLKGDPTAYRIIIAPADAPIRIGDVDVDSHFNEPLVAMDGDPEFKEAE